MGNRCLGRNSSGFWEKVISPLNLGKPSEVSLPPQEDFLENTKKYEI